MRGVESEIKWIKAIAKALKRRTNRYYLIE
jgi:hypothetical protein